MVILDDPSDLAIDVIDWVSVSGKSNCCAIRTISFLGLVFLVLVRYAYGFPDFHIHIQSTLTMLLRSTPITRASSLLRADVPWINRAFPTCAAEVSLHLLQQIEVPSMVPLFPML